MSRKLKYIGIIPARYASTRFPGKPLAEIGGKTMIERVYKQARKALDHVYVATDDQRIYDAVGQFSGRAVYTSRHHKSGTDRCTEAIGIIENKEKISFDIVINIQGDEPFIHPSQIQKLMNCFSDPETQIATLVKPFTSKNDLFDPNKVKVIADKHMHAIYFSRAVIPFLRNIDRQDEWLSNHQFYFHLGIYAYKKQILTRITELPPSELEMAESLEQLRWIENGLKIKLVLTEHDSSIGVDTPEDLEKIRKLGLI